VVTSALFVLGLFILLAISVVESPRNSARDAGKLSSVASSLLLSQASVRKEDDADTAAPLPLCANEADLEYIVMAREVLTAKEVESLTAFAEALADPRCSDTEADSSLARELASWDCEDAYRWRMPAKGVYKQTKNAPVPCNQSAWVDGVWQSFPMPYHCCNKGPALVKCPKSGGGRNVIETPHSPSCSRAKALKGKCEDDSTLLCLPFLKAAAQKENQGGTTAGVLNQQQQQQEEPSCLIYTFGIAGQWEFEDWAGGEGLSCEVHASDPTDKYRKQHQSHRAKNVQFHFWGLRGSKEAKTDFQTYGKLGGEMKTIGEIWTALGHREEGRQINAVKLDCEGCEWDSLVHFAEKEADALQNVCTIILEIHVSDTLQMKSIRQLQLMAKFWNLYIESFGFRLWYLHPNPGGRWDQGVNPLLVELGFEENTCCYEIALHRPGCFLPS